MDVCRGGAIIGLVDMWDDTTTTDRYTKRITLKKEFQWLLSEDFQKLCEGFNPVNYKPVKEPKDGSGVGAETGTFSKERISTFWKTFDKLVEDQIRSNPGIEIDKVTISREDLQDELVSTGNFIQSDAAIMIDHMEQKDEIEQIDGWGTIRRKVKP